MSASQVFRIDVDRLGSEGQRLLGTQSKANVPYRRGAMLAVAAIGILSAFFLYRHCRETLERSVFLCDARWFDTQAAAMSAIAVAVLFASFAASRRRTMGKIQLVDGTLVRPGQSFWFFVQGEHVESNRPYRSNDSSTIAQLDQIAPESCHPISRRQARFLIWEHWCKRLLRTLRVATFLFAPAFILVRHQVLPWLAIEIERTPMRPGYLTRHGLAGVVHLRRELFRSGASWFHNRRHEITLSELIVRYDRRLRAFACPRTVNLLQWLVSIQIASPLTVFGLILPSVNFGDPSEKEAALAQGLSVAFEHIFDGPFLNIRRGSRRFTLSPSEEVCSHDSLCLFEAHSPGAYACATVTDHRPRIPSKRILRESCEGIPLGDVISGFFYAAES